MTSAQNGTSWDHAYRELRDALAAHSGASGVVHFYVAEGTYLPTPTMDDNVSFDLRAGDRLYGGFIGYDPSGTPGVGYEASHSDRQGSFDATILSGDIDPSNTDISARADHVVRVIGNPGSGNSGAKTVVDGFRIEKGFADDTANSVNGSGGGLIAGAVFWLELANLRVTNCTARAKGGGIALYSQANLRMRRCQITNNSCGYRTIENGQQVLVGSGGGLYMSYIASQPFGDQGYVAIANSTFTENLAPNGGAVCAERLGFGQFSMLNCLLHHNTGVTSCGGVQVLSPAIATHTADVTFSHLTVTENTGGGIEFVAPPNATTDETKVCVASCILWNNSEAGAGVDRDLYGSYFAAALAANNNPEVRYCDIGSPNGPMTTVWQAAPYVGNINEDPVFIAPGMANYRLSVSAPSPCIDVADDRALPAAPQPSSTPPPYTGLVGDRADLDEDNDPWELVLVDLDELAREVEVGTVPNGGVAAGSPPISDMGCYEVPAAIDPGGGTGSGSGGHQ